MGDYTEGICGDGAAFLHNGQMMTISEVVDALNDCATLLTRHNALEHTLANINVHFDMLCSHELRQHGFVSHDHDIDFQVFRVLCGYKELMDSHTALVEAVAWLREVDDTREWLMEFTWLRKWSALDQCISEARSEVDRLIEGE